MKAQAQQLRRWAAVGVAHEIAEGEARLTALRGTLASLQPRPAKATLASSRRMTEAQRRAVSLRMRRYWARRRKEAK